jgi:ATP-dependent protease ClpP protease subunit
MTKEKIKKEGSKTSIFIDKDLMNAEDYRDAIMFLKRAKEKDIITFIINSFGGDFFLCLYLYNNILQSKATTIAEINLANSAGAFLSLICDECIIHPFSSMMLHSPNFAQIDGTPKQIQAMMLAYEDLAIQFTETCCKDFLTEKEIVQLLNGKHFYFLAHEIEARFANRKIVRGLK